MLYVQTLDKHTESSILPCKQLHNFDMFVRMCHIDTIKVLQEMKINKQNAWGKIEKLIF